jgi:hypothetical protein
MLPLPSLLDNLFDDENETSPKDPPWLPVQTLVFLFLLIKVQ